MTRKALGQTEGFLSSWSAIRVRANEHRPDLLDRVMNYVSDLHHSSEEQLLRMCPDLNKAQAGDQTKGLVKRLHSLDMRGYWIAVNDILRILINSI